MVNRDKTAVLNIFVWIPFLWHYIHSFCLPLRIITISSLKQKIERVLLSYQSSDFFALKSMPRQSGWGKNIKEKKKSVQLAINHIYHYFPSHPGTDFGMLVGNLPSLLRKAVTTYLRSQRHRLVGWIEHQRKMISFL